MRAITASFLLEIVCLLAFQSHIGLERRSQPPPTNRIMQTSLFISGFCRASGLIQMSFPNRRFSETVWKHLGCQRSEQEPADGERIADALSREHIDENL